LGEDATVMGKRMALWFVLGVLAVALGFSAYVRLAPSDLARWHVAPVVDRSTGEGVAGEVVAREGGAQLWLETAAARDLLARLDAVALATPRTQRLAGSVEEGRITWITRSALWGFPDYTTAEARADGLYIDARLRFGQSDMGVNAARLNGWKAALSGM
jgi:hypothetical protein